MGREIFCVSCFAASMQNFPQLSPKFRAVIAEIDALYWFCFNGLNCYGICHYAVIIEAMDNSMIIYYIIYIYIYIYI
jgi:hypothetical protein